MQQITKSKEEARNVKDVEFIFENTESFSIFIF